MKPQMAQSSRIDESDLHLCSSAFIRVHPWFHFLDMSRASWGQPDDDGRKAVLPPMAASSRHSMWRQDARLSKRTERKKCPKASLCPIQHPTFNIPNPTPARSAAPLPDNQ